MFDWVCIHFWRVFVLEILRNLTYRNYFCKVTGNKTLISMKQDFTRDKIWRGVLFKSQLLKLLKRKNAHGCFHKLAAYWHIRLLWPFPWNFHKISSENHCDCKQNRSEQKSTSVTVLKHIKIFQGGSKLPRKSNSTRDSETTLTFKNIENFLIRGTIAWVAW